MAKSHSEAEKNLNVKLWEYSLSNPENILDTFYFVDINRIVIPHNVAFHKAPNSDDVNDLAAIEISIIQIIKDIASNEEQKINDSEWYNKQITKIRRLMQNPSANLTTFRSFWPVLDMSFSVYSNLTEDQQLQFLYFAVREFIKNRHSLYESNGYSLNTLQILSDVNAHKAQGATAANKLGELFEHYSLSRASNVEQLLSRELTFALMEEAITISDLDHLCKQLGVKFEWHQSNQKKKPDFFLHLRSNEFYFGEAKHKKEGGGGQNDQIKEIIKFIGFTEKRQNFGYISFLDGIYFNSLISDTKGLDKRLNKGQTQSKEIRDSLGENVNNYFLNTEGMKKFLEIKVGLK
jgi:hypothetical protein